MLTTRQRSSAFKLEAKQAIALKFYADEKLSLGQAAELANFSKFEFIQFLGENSISLFRYERNDYENGL